MEIVIKFVKFSFQLLVFHMCLNCYGGVLWGRDLTYFPNGCKIAPKGLLSSFTFSVQFSSVQSLSRVRLSITPLITAQQASLSVTNPRSPHRLMSIESVMSSSHLILCRPLLFLSPIPPSFRVFSMSQLFAWGGQSTGVSAFSIIPSNVIPGLPSFRMGLLDLLAVQEALKSLLQYHSSKASVLWHSAFFTV